MQDLMKLFLVAMVMLSTSVLSAQTKKNTTGQGAPKPCKDTMCTRNNVWNVIKNCQPIQTFKLDPVPDKDLMAMIHAARQAQTSVSQQPLKFVIVKDRKLINDMKEACVAEAMAFFDKQPEKKESRQNFETLSRTRFESYFSAPVYIVVLTYNDQYSLATSNWNGPAAGAYLMLAARALGYGTAVWTDLVSERTTKTVLKIPDGYTRTCIIPVGVPAEWPKPQEKKNIDEYIVRETF